jgi:hypothetical protein
MRWKMPRATFILNVTRQILKVIRLHRSPRLRHHDCHTRQSRLSLTHKVDAGKTLCGRGSRCPTLADVFRFAVSAICAPCRVALTAASAPLSPAPLSPALLSHAPLSSAPLSSALLSSALLSSALLSSSGVLAHDGTRR